MTTRCCASETQNGPTDSSVGSGAKGNPNAAGRAPGGVVVDGVCPLGGRKVGYLRVSTDEQRPDRQIDGLEALCDEFHIETLSAASQDRPVFDGVIAGLEAGDTFQIWDLDRAFRSTIDALLHADALRERGVHFRIATLNIDTSTEFGELLYTVVAAFARFERRTLIRRTKEGMAAARRRGVHVGRPYALSPEKIAIAHEWVGAGSVALEAAAEQLDVHPDTLIRGFRRLGLTGEMGGGRNDE